MPLYEYECTKCQHRFEVIQKFSDPPRDECPVCQGPVKKLLSAPAIQFKGTGWYVTDYGPKKSAGDSGSNDSKPDKPEKSKASDTKPKKEPKVGSKKKD